MEAADAAACGVRRHTRLPFQPARPPPQPAPSAPPPGCQLPRLQLGGQRARQLAHHLLAVLRGGGDEAHHPDVVVAQPHIPVAGAQHRRCAQAAGGGLGQARHQAGRIRAVHALRRTAGGT